MVATTISGDYDGVVASGLGAYIKRARERLGWTQADLAVRAGLITPSGEANRTLIAQLETGRTKVSLPETRRAIADALGVRHLDLLVAAGELTVEEAGVGTTPVAEDPDVEVICALLRLTFVPPAGLRSLRLQVEMWADAARGELRNPGNNPGHQSAAIPAGVG